MQVRAWNQADQHVQQLPPAAAVEIAAAHLFGLFRGLRMPQNALAIALSVQERQDVQIGRRRPDRMQDERADLSERAEGELRERIRPTHANGGETSVDTELGTITVRLAEPLLMLARELREARATETAIAALRSADLAIDEWQSSRSREPEAYGTVRLLSGVELRVPDSFEPRK
jgi:hypothetical protein